MKRNHEESLNPMTFLEFWKKLSDGGVTPEGDRYSITDDGRLHILSPGNKNKKYRLTQTITERYFTRDIPEMGEAHFRRRRSSYFYNVYRHIMRRNT
jgi:hypothetical protein